jgi:hypothetical protein
VFSFVDPSAALARVSKSVAIVRYRRFEASRSAVSAISRKRAASARRNLGVIVNSFEFAGDPHVAAEASVETGDANWDGWHVWMLAVENK